MKKTAQILCLSGIIAIFSCAYAGASVPTSGIQPHDPNASIMPSENASNSSSATTEDKSILDTSGLEKKMEENSTDSRAKSSSVKAKTATGKRCKKVKRGNKHKSKCAVKRA